MSCWFLVYSAFYLLLERNDNFQISYVLVQKIEVYIFIGEKKSSERSSKTEFQIKKNKI